MYKEKFYRNEPCSRDWMWGLVLAPFVYLIMYICALL